MDLMLDAFSFESDRYTEHKSMAGILIFYSRPSVVINGRLLMLETKKLFNIMVSDRNWGLGLLHPDI